MSPSPSNITPRLLVLVYRPKFASNVGTILRSSALLGANGVIIASDKGNAFWERAEKVGMLTRHKYILETKWIDPGGVVGLLGRMKLGGWHVTGIEYSGTGGGDACDSGNEEDANEEEEEAGCSSENSSSDLISEAKSSFKSGVLSESEQVSRNSRISQNIIQPKPAPAYPISNLPLHLRHCYVFGSEDGGIADEVIDACDSTAHVPQARWQSSLNVGHSLGITLYDRLRREGLGEVGKVQGGQALERQAEQAGCR